MSKSLKKKEAILLRKSGQSIKDISSKIGASRSTVSIWCRDVVLSVQQKKVLFRKMVEAGHRGRCLGAKMNRDKKIDTIKNDQIFADNMLHKINSRDRLVAGLCLYWAEGSKKDHSLIFTNSDPDLILFMKMWYKEFFYINDSELMPRLFINQIHKNRIDKVLCFWSKLLMLPKSQFGNPIFLKVHNKKVYENFDQYYGVLALRVKDPVRFKYKVLGLIEAFRKQIHLSG